MQTSEFLALIAKHPKKLLRFKDHQGGLVHPSYHVSEVKTAIFETVDCGNMAHHWEETILQLWLSDDPDAERAMETGKVTGILKKVEEKITVNHDTELRIEYGNDEFPPVVFHVDKIETTDKDVTVSLRPPVLQCKLEERGGDCARPEPAAKAAKGDDEGSCCSGSKCC
ncbi:MAG: DUF6428 family protein [Verrucomicrobium sp.]|nr:DUF6428 family protein [Verrucomicrobium sp.]